VHTIRGADCSVRIRDIANLMFESTHRMLGGASRGGLGAGGGGGGVSQHFRAPPTVIHQARDFDACAARDRCSFCSMCRKNRTIPAFRGPAADLRRRLPGACCESFAGRAAVRQHPRHRVGLPCPARSPLSIVPDSHRVASTLGSAGVQQFHHRIGSAFESGSLREQEPSSPSSSSR